MSEIEKKNNHETGLEVAVIGMSSRYPGVKNIDEFWEILKTGTETITFFTDEELQEAGYSPQALKNPNFVNARGKLECAQYFDASFFGYTPGEAQLMDPQMRVFHECVWEAMENAGYVPSTYDGLIGIYAGAKNNTNWYAKTLFVPNDGSVDGMTTALITSKEHIAMRMSYMFNLKGPSFTLFTACSTSLVAVHLACQAVLSGECDIAMAGGITIGTPLVGGHVYEPGMVFSKDGHVRTFDAEATGMVDSSGCGIVVLKVLEEAIADRDNIYAVIKGTGINNDGSRKIGYTAPSIKGQEALYREVYSAAEVDTESIAMMECHGTATPLGDPVEVEALTRAFDTDKRNYCGLGSVKSNLGHTDAAAGTAGLIKAVLAIHNQQIPPTLHYRSPNPKLDLENGPFYVNTTLKDWKNDEYPLRAAVSALGIGGTNAHVVVQEPPPDSVYDTTPETREYKLLTLSAKTPTALDTMTENLRLHLDKNPDINLADVAYTLQKGRAVHGNRRTFVCSDVEDALKQLAEPGSAPVQPFFAGNKERPVVFMFSGQGSQYVNMGRDLYLKEESFRQDIDECFDCAKQLIGEDIKHILYPQTPEQQKEAEEKINRIYYTQPVKFSFEYSMARLLMRWGIKPHAMLGHSFGEYIIACLCGVFSLEDAMKLVMIRGEELENAPTGAMLSVSLPEAELVPLLTPGVSLAAVNTDYLCLVAGTPENVEAFQKQLEAKDIDTLLLRVSRAGHSPLMDPILESFKKRLSAITFNKPEIPFVSGVTGTWITNAEARDPEYWKRHLRETVRFGDGLKTLFETPNTIFLEVGAGKGMSTFARQFIDSGDYPGHLTMNIVRHNQDSITDDCFFLNRLGQLWTFGKTVDWDAFYGDEKRRRVPLPTYPFESQYFWIEIDPFKALAKGLSGPSAVPKDNIDDWFHVPSWKTTLLPVPKPDPQSAHEPCLVFVDPENRGNKLVQLLQKDDRPVFVVHRSDVYQKKDSNEFSIDPTNGDHYQMLFKDLQDNRTLPSTIIHLWNVSPRNSDLSVLEWNEDVQDTGYYSLLYIARAIGRLSISNDMQMEVVTNGMHSVAGEPLDHPEKATVIGPVKNIPQEYPNIRCRSVDIQLPEPGTVAEECVLRQLRDEFLTPQTREQLIAYRGNRRFVLQYQATPLPPSEISPDCFRQNGVYLIPGGLGGVGLTIGAYLAENFKAKLILTSRTGLPPREQWDEYLNQHTDKKDKTARRIRSVMDIEALGGDLLVAAVDVTNETQMKELVDTAVKRFGPVNGILQCAYSPDGTIIDQRTKQTSESVFAPKVQGTLVLDSIFSQQEPLDFFILCSSLAAIFAPIGQVGYTAANAFQDAFAHYRSLTNPGTHNVSINWTGWAEVGGAVEAMEELSPALGEKADKLPEMGLSNKDGVEVFKRIVAAAGGTHQILVSQVDTQILTRHLNTERTSGLQEVLGETEVKSTRLKRPQLNSDYVEPQSDVEKSIAKIWCDLFGFETVGVQDSFFDLGGDSLKAMTVASKIHKEVGKKIPIAEFFRTPTIEELAQFITGGEGQKETQAPIPTVDDRQYYPVSPVQRPIFINHYNNPDNTPYYNIPVCYMFPSVPDVQALETVFKQLFERHESYRASFHMVDGEPMQQIHPEVDFKIPIKECLGASMEELQDIIHDLLTPFDITKAPLYRAILLKLAEDKSILVTDTHSLILDGTSSGLFIGDFLGIFSGKQLGPLPVRYRDYACWYHDREVGGELAVSRDYWLEQFKEPVQLLQLPIDFPRPEQFQYEGRPVSFKIDESLLHRLRDLGRETGTTMFMMFIAAYNVLLHRYTGQEDILVGSRLACRLHPDLALMAGKFSNTLGFRTRPNSSHTFTEFLAQVKEISLGAFKHQEYPFEDLIDQFDFPRESGRNLFFDTVFVYNNMLNDPKEGQSGDSGPGLSFFDYRRIRTPYDLLFQPNEIGDNVFVLIYYPISLFKHETIMRLIADFNAILAGIVENPGAMLSEIPLSIEN